MVRQQALESLDELQKDLDTWLEAYNERRTHQGKMCCGRTPRETFDDGMRIAKEKLIGDAAQTSSDKRSTTRVTVRSSCGYDN